MLFSSLLVFSIFALLPSQLALHLWPSWSIINGIRVDYLSPTLYFIDILLLLFILMHKPKITLPLPIIIILVINIAISLSPLVTLYRLAQLSIFILFAVALKNYFSRYSIFVYLGLLASLLWSSLLAIYQFLFGSSWGGIWYWLGERPLSLVSPHVAKIQLFNQGVFLRPYATFPHPNALAGYLLVTLIILFSFRSYFSKYIFYPIVALSLVAFLLTFSRSALIAAIVYFFLFAKKSRLYLYLLSPFFLFIIFLPHPESITLRIPLYLKSLSQVLEYPLGTGLGASLTLQSYPFNPVHSLPILLLLELGLPFGIYLFYKTLSRPLNLNIFIPIVLISLVDHYWLTQHTPLLLLVLLKYIPWPKS